MTDLVGKRLGDYRLTQKLGGGGFADVYLGEHIYIGTEAAIKVLNGKFTPEEIEGLRAEASLQAKLKHPNIVRLIGFSVANVDGQDIPYIIMEYAASGSLDKLHPRGTILSLPLIVSYVKQIVAALQYAHNQRVIHRDIKPANFFLGENGEALLGDFGIAVIAHRTGSWEAQKPVGSWHYAAPEHFHFKSVPASDQYSLAVVVYQWLCGSLPFAGDFIQLGYQHNHTPPRSLSLRIPTISSEVEQVVMRALAKDPHDRFPTVQAFAEALRQASQRIGTMLLAYGGHTNWVKAVAWSPDSSRLASGSWDQTVQVWEAITGVMLLTYQGHSGVVKAVAWSPDCKRLASGSLDGTIQVWDANTGSHISTYRGYSHKVGAVAWSHDGTRIASASYGVHIWRAV